MKPQEIKFKNLNQNYSIIIGSNVLKILPKKIKSLCPKTKKIALIFDNGVPNKFKKKISNQLRSYELLLYSFKAEEKTKSIKFVTLILNKLFKKNFNRSDLIIGIGGGITGDLTGFTASIFKRGVNFISIPTTLLSQADAAVGGKTGVNSSYGKNMIGSFYQPKLVISDTSFLQSLKRKEMVCGYAEILKHSLIKDKKFFSWLKKNTKNIFLNKKEIMNYAIKKSCEIKLSFVNKDVNEKNLRMILNFGHTFAHGFEATKKFSGKINHGEAVLLGMAVATQLSHNKKIISSNDFNLVKKHYVDLNLPSKISTFFKKYEINKIISFMKSDKKNYNKKINLILLKKVGEATKPNNFNIKSSDIKKFLIKNYN